MATPRRTAIKTARMLEAIVEELAALRKEIEEIKAAISKPKPKGRPKAQ